MPHFGIQPDTAGLLEIGWIIQNVPGADASMGTGELRALAASQGIAVPPGGVEEEERDPSTFEPSMYTPTPGAWTPPPDQLTPPPTQWTPAMIADPSPEIIVPPAPSAQAPSLALPPSAFEWETGLPVAPPAPTIQATPTAQPAIGPSPFDEDGRVWSGDPGAVQTLGGIPGIDLGTGLLEDLLGMAGGFVGDISGALGGADPVFTDLYAQQEEAARKIRDATMTPYGPWESPPPETDPSPFSPIDYQVLPSTDPSSPLYPPTQQELAGVGGLPAEPELPAVEQPAVGQLGILDGLSFAEWAEQESARLQEQWEETFADFEAQLRMDLAARDAPEQPPGGFKAEEGIDARYFDTQTTMAKIFAKQLGIPSTGRSAYEDFLADQWKVSATEYALLGQGLQGGLPTIGEYYAAGLGAEPTFLEGESTEDLPISFWNYLEGRSGPLSSMQGDFLSEITNLGPVPDLMSPSLSLSPLQNQQSLFASLGSFGDIAEEQVFRGALNLQYPGFMAENMATQVFDSPLKQEYFTQAPPTIAGPGGIGLRGSLSVFDQPAPDTSFLGFLKEQYGIASTGGLAPIPNWQIQGALTPLPAPTAVPAPTIDDEGSFMDSVVGTLGAAKPSIFR
jgi:hypothetical protein